MQVIQAETFGAEAQTHLLVQDNSDASLQTHLKGIEVQTRAAIRASQQSCNWVLELMRPSP